MSNLKKEMIAFWTTGENMNRFLRDLWEEGNLTHAIKTAKDGLGMSSDLAIKLFEGDMHLVGDTREGDHTLNLINDESNYKGTTTEEWFQKFKERYISLQMDKIEYDSYLRKNMIKAVKNFNCENIEDVEHEVKTSSMNMEKKKFEYLKQIALLCKFTSHTLDEIEKEMNKSFEIPSVSKVFNKKIDIDEFIDRMNRIDESVVEEGKPGESLHGWISPFGIIYPCEYMGHIHLADLLGEKKLSPGCSENDLEKSGWIKLTSDKYLMMQEEKITQKQKNYIIDHSIERPGKLINFNGNDFKDIDELMKYFEEKCGRI